MRVPVHLVRALGYIIVVVVVMAFFMKDLLGTWAQSPFFHFSLILPWFGRQMINYKVKVLPFSRAEKIFCNVFEVAFISALVLYLVFVLLAK